MILETPHSNRDNVLLINDLVGKPYNLIKAIRMQGTVSKKMIIAEYSANMKNVPNSALGTTYGNIELRPLGILVGLFKGLTNFTWVVPYYQLTIYNNDCSSLFAQGRFIRFKRDEAYEKSKSFLHKLLKQKAGYESKYDFLNFKEA